MDDTLKAAWRASNRAEKKYTNLRTIVAHLREQIRSSAVALDMAETEMENAEAEMETIALDIRTLQDQKYEEERRGR